jgi:hypothetical protein
MKKLSPERTWCNNDNINKILGILKIEEDKLRPCAKDLIVLLQGIEVRKKFSLTKYGEVAKIRL